MGAVMLIELWERLRGYDKWVETEATILSSELLDRLRDRNRPDIWDVWLLSFYRWQSKCNIRWTDVSGAPHAGTYAVVENSSLFQKYEGQRISIRYNPFSPDEFYSRALFIDRVFIMTLRAMYLLFFVVCAATFAFGAFQHFQKLHR
jgi:hypothetical protein